MYEELEQVRAQMAAEGQFEIGTVNVRGETLKTFANAPASLRDLWALASLHGDKPYLIYEDESWSYAEAYAETASIANWMHANGIKQGDRVAWLSAIIPNGCCVIGRSLQSALPWSA